MGECVLLATQSGAAFPAVAAHSAGLHTAAATARPAGRLRNSSSSPSDAKVLYDFLVTDVSSVQNSPQARQTSFTWGISLRNDMQ